MSLKEPVPAELAYFDQLPNSANVRILTVKRLYGDISDSSVWRNSGKSIPAPRNLTPGVATWNVGALRQALGIKSCAFAENKQEDSTNSSPPLVRKDAAVNKQPLTEPESGHDQRSSQPGSFNMIVSRS